MGTSTFAEYTVMPEIALAKVSPEAPARRLRAVRLRALDRDRRRALHRAGRSRARRCAVFGCGLVGLGAVIGARLAGAERIVAIDLSEERLAQARHHGATDTRRRRRRHGRLDPRRDRRLRRRLHLRGDRQRRRDAQAVEAAREAWGLATMCGVAGKGELLEIVPRLLITGRRVTGSSFGGVKGRTQVPLLVDRWLAGEIDVESPDLAPAHARRGQPRLRADGGPGRHPQRDPLLGLGPRQLLERLLEHLARLRAEHEQPAVEHERRDAVDADRLRLPRRVEHDLEVCLRVVDRRSTSPAASPTSAASRRSSSGSPMFAACSQ